MMGRRSRLCRMAMLFDELAAASDAVAATTKRNEKVAILADVLGRLAPDEIMAGAAFLRGTTIVGRIGVGWSTLRDVTVEPAATATLTVGDVERAVRELTVLDGEGVMAARRERLRDVLGAATEREQRLLVAIFGGELRQGALDGVMTTALARAADVPVSAMRRAAMMSGSLDAAAYQAWTGGRAALDAVALEPLHPIQPMLASPAADVADAFGDDGAPLSVEWKLDGARIQAHRRDGDVRVYTRNLNEVTTRLPVVVDVVRELPGGDLVLDGEAMGIRDDGAPRRFQDTMGDFGADESGRGDGLRPFFFDILHVGGSPVHDEPLSTRRELLTATVPSAARLPSIVTADPAEANAFLADAVAAGHEGVMVKDLDRPYEAGRRGAAWRKVKPVYTFDLVVLAVEWGHGRRTGWLSNLHLGARAGGPAAEFVMVGKTFKGLTDELLRWQTERFLGLEIGREGHVVHVRPEQVVEIAVDGVQVSTRYPGGVALRFARVRRYRDDKSAGDADTIDAVRSLL